MRINNLCGIRHVRIVNALNGNCTCVHLFQGFEERLKASATEIRDLEGLGEAMHDENNGDAGLTTGVRYSFVKPIGCFGCKPLV